MALITIDDMKTHIYEGVMDAISDGDDELIEEAIAAAIDLAKGYCSLYNVDALFAGTPPDTILKYHVKGLAKWIFMGLGNPNIDYQDAETRNTLALNWLKDVQSGRIAQPNWPPRVSPEGTDTYFHATSSSPKRTNHY